MASISKEKNHYSVRVQVDGKEARFRGFTNKRDAQRFGDKLECLKAARKTGGVSPELAVWTSELEKNSPELYKRLASFGLVEQMEETHTLKGLIQAHRESRRDVKAATLTT